MREKKESDASRVAYLQYLEFDLYIQEYKYNYNIPELLIAPDKFLVSHDYQLK